VLLCDVDSGLVHDHDLVMTRRDRRLIVTAPDGRRLWGTADAAFTGGPAGLTTGAPTDGHGDVFAGVHPVDTAVGRRPADTATGRGPAAGPTPDSNRDDPTTTPARVLRRGQATHPRPQAVGSAGRKGAPPAARPRTSRRPTCPTRGRTTSFGPPRTTAPATLGARMETALFPDGPPPLPDTIQDHHDRMDMAWALSVLMGHRDLIRRLATEAGAQMTT
jgi:hypothetical protein